MPLFSRISLAFCCTYLDFQIAKIKLALIYGDLYINTTKIKGIFLFISSVTISFIFHRYFNHSLNLVASDSGLLRINVQYVVPNGYQCRF